MRHRKDYIEKIIETETNSQRELIRNYGEIESILHLKREKLQLISQENHEYEVAIKEERQLQQQNKEELEKLTHYLQTLVQINSILFGELERSCSEDREVQVLLSEKLEKLMLVNDKITENEMFSKFDINCLHNQKRLGKTPNSSNSQTLKK